MSPRGSNDALCVIDELPALEHTEVVEASRDLIFRYTGERLCNFGTGQTTPTNLVQLPFRIHGEGHESVFEYQALFDCDATTTFGSKSLFVDKLGFKPSGKYVTVKNGDDRSQFSMGSVKVTMSIGCNFKEATISYSNLRGPANVSRDPRRVNLPICINSLKDAEGHDASHYLCDVQNFRAECAIQRLSEEETLVLVPDENDAFSYRQFLLQLAEMKDQVEADDFVNLLTKVVDVQLSERKELIKDDKVTTGDTTDGLEDSFHARVIREFPSLCVNSLSHDGPVARQLHGSPFRVKLRLKEGVEPQGRHPYRIPESYRPEMEKTIANLLEFKLIEPSISHYSNPVFLVPKPPLRDGSPGGLQFVWDGRSVKRDIKTDSFLIPRVEDLIERITRLKHEVNAKGITDMWISTLDLRTSFVTTDSG